MNIRHRFQMLGSDHIDIQQIIILIYKLGEAFYLIEYYVAFLVSSYNIQRVLSFNSLQV